MAFVYFFSGTDTVRWEHWANLITFEDDEIITVIPKTCKKKWAANFKMPEEMFHTKKIK